MSFGLMPTHEMHLSWLPSPLLPPVAECKVKLEAWVCAGTNTSFGIGLESSQVAHGEVGGEWLAGDIDR